MMSTVSALNTRPQHTPLPPRGKAFESLFDKATSYRLMMITIGDVSFGGRCEPCDDLTNYLSARLPSDLVIEKLLLKAKK